MKLYVDNREKRLYSLLVAFNFANQSEQHNSESDILENESTSTSNELKKKKKKTTKKHESDSLEIISKQLELGDLILCNDSDEILLLFERKSIADLASSIQDGRYKEQSSRLNAFSVHDHNIVYIIEGNIERVYSKSRVKSGALKSAVVSLNLNKGFSTLKTNNIDDSAKWILAYCYKVEKDNDLKCKLEKMVHNNVLKNSSIINNDTNNNDDESINNKAETEEKIQKGGDDNGSGKHLEHLSKQAKSKFINRNNCQVLMLSMIPYVSTNIAKSILDEFGTIDKLMVALREDENCLNKIKIESGGKKRSIGKNVIKNIVEMLGL